MQAKQLQIGTRRAFTLIELLVVIAIIAILAAIIFPTFSRVREQARQTSCMSDMQEIGRSLKLYALDHGGKYPATLFGYAEVLDKDNIPQYYDGTNGTPVSAGRIKLGPLYGKRRFLKASDLYICPDSPNKNPALVTTAVYPTGVAYTGTVQREDARTGTLQRDGNGKTFDAYFYPYDSYDIGPQLDANGKPVTGVTELHYSLDWTGQFGSDDAPNQLKYPNAPDNTIVTWCSYHAAVNGSDKVLVLFKSGQTKPVDAKTFSAQGPLAFKY